MSSSLLIFPLIIILPAVLSRIVQKAGIDDWISPVVACYAVGILCGNLGILQLSDESFELLAQLTVPLAIPLFLITTDFIHWIRHSGPALKSIALAMTGVFLAAFTTFFIFQNSVPATITSIGMLTGSLIGSNANLSAVGLALDAPPDIFTMTSSADVIIGAVFLLYLIAVAKKLYEKILPPYVYIHDPGEENLNETDPGKISLPRKLMELGASLGLAMLIAGAAAAISYLLVRTVREDIVIITISILGILTAISSGKIRSMTMAEPFGQYLLLIFCIAIGLQTNFQKMIQHSGGIMALTAAYYGFCMLYQLILSRMFKIDVDTSIMTTTGTVYGPIFIAQVASAIKNREVIITGMITAIFGYAIGNFSGIGIAWLLAKL